MVLSHTNIMLLEMWSGAHKQMNEEVWNFVIVIHYKPRSYIKMTSNRLIWCHNDVKTHAMLQDILAKL